MFASTDQAPAFNFFLKALAPSVYIILVATACYRLHLDNLVRGLWLVVVYYFGFRLLYNLILSRALLLDWFALSAQTIAGVAAGYMVYRYLILVRRPLFPDLDNIGNQLWIVVALFLYAAFNSIRTSGAASAKRKNRYLRSRFAKLRKEYGALIENQFPGRYMELVAYAILIHEGFNRPWVARMIERAVFPWGSHTLGPMQVHTTARLSNSESVHVGVSQLRQCFEETMREVVAQKPATRYETIRLAVAKYNRDEDYINELLVLLYMLWAQVAPEYRTEFERMHIADPRPPENKSKTSPSPQSDTHSVGM